ncbi:hypothetical protein HDU97_000625 [Phlyctochytrium planicorne]|nr:hypothetical protein HDU97_000625 [Phlyctochytrium planicorne]
MPALTPSSTPTPTIHAPIDMDTHLRATSSRGSIHTDDEEKKSNLSQHTLAIIDLTPPISSDAKQLDASKDIESHQSPSPSPQHQGVDPDFIRVPLERPQFIAVFLGLALSILLAALDQTILATALESIVKDLGNQELIPWVGSSYLLTATSVSVIYGKLADIFGRKSTFIFALVIFVLGSVICAVAPSLPALIGGRAVAGIGGGGIFSLVLIIISDVVSISDRGKYQGIIGAVFGLASVIGPLMGGAFTDHLSWRYCFWINVPVGAITLFTVLVFLKFPPVEGGVWQKMGRVDWLGAGVLTVAVSCLITPLQLGGSTWDWNAPQTIALFVVAVVLFAAFVCIELWVAKEPIIPAALFMNRSVPALLIIAFCLGATFFAAVYYISLFFQVSYGMTATQAGLQTIPMVLGLVALSIISGQVLSRTGYYLPFLYIGPLIIVTGLALVSTLTDSSSSAQQILYLLITGIGSGCIIQIRILALQASVDASKIAIATAVSQFCQSLGGTIGVAFTGTVFNNVLANNVRANPHFAKVLGGVDPAKINLPILREVLGEKDPELMKELVDAFVGAFQVAYRTILPFPVLILLMAFLVKQYVMKSRH